ncbi:MULTISPECIES: hypothetical protein [Okeania]|uniref:Uncharacterized protein n=1 Tax=Okeania hirsuta TaxID=1458930 RepID=A0A3N6PP44_9CYAN|nr:MULTISPECIES: hypothetical protein [Okeania]NET14738.1 hypothetical protein [Okeania sp. SIO1H6]NES75628.1 hypothetical protein [Okeania sp. SIO1H4]NES88657.1 hypothetical protein [Okeania sp. SIO2B9]NET19027.1 hypothetical protein [Okeania sp. SIO1H5]NET75356.1 hypothetical protein [Okeania sp. SIO1F9]
MKLSSISGGLTLLFDSNINADEAQKAGLFITENLRYKASPFMDKKEKNPFSQSSYLQEDVRECL